MEKQFDLLVFICRAQPFHVEHKRIIDTALENAKNVLVLVGSSGKARTIRNPFTFEERKKMIYGAFQHLFEESPFHPDYSHLRIKPLYDKTYNDAAWIKQVQDIVTKTVIEINNPDGFNLNGMGNPKIGLIGASKDNTSYYLKIFPQWDSLDVGIKHEIHATAIREHFLDGTFERYQIQDTLVPKNVCDFLYEDFINTAEYKTLQNEIKFVRDYKKQWEAAPYPVKFLTCDSLVEQSGHILVVKRRSEPGKGLWALPGGHLELDETLIDGAIRELKEETGIKVPEPVLRGSIVNTHMFDDPHRSTIGRVVTFAAHIRLTNDVKLPKVRGMDDAEKAVWLPIADMREDMFFDDHYFLACYFLGV